MDALPTLPRYNLGRVFSLRDRLEAAFLHYSGKPLAGSEFAEFVTLLAKELGTDYRWDTLVETVRILPNRNLTEGTLRGLAWRIAGNLKSLQEGRPAIPWSTQSDDEWIPFEVMRCQTERDHRERIVTRFWLQALAGSVCPQIVQKTWTSAQCALVARRVGFTKRKGKYPFIDPAQLVGLRFYGLVEAARSLERPDFFTVQTSATLATYNRQILSARILRQPPCPIRNTNPCHRCPIGYQECGAATHPLTYITRYCAGCEKEAFFDPLVQSHQCVMCCRREKLRPKQSVN